MKFTYYILFLLLSSVASLTAQVSDLFDDFEGNGTISTWLGDDCDIELNVANPFKQGDNTSNQVMEYKDVGGQYANVRFEVEESLNLTSKYVFAIKVFVPSASVSGGQPNQVSLKLQDGRLGEPWSTQTEIVKPIVLDQWQTLQFDFKYDNFINLNSGSLPPTLRTDLNRVVIQINGENNNDEVLAYVDDFYQMEADENNPVFDNLVWSDEFEEDGPINTDNWFHQTLLPNGESWFNGEVQHYTDRTENARVEDGVLKIVAKKESFTDQGVNKQYTSARLNSKFAFTYGKVEVRAKLPFGVGTWPAIWMLGQNIGENGGYWDNEGFGDTPWPACGEIDIMEHWGDNQNFVQSAMHTPSSFGNTFNKGGQVIPTASTDFHVYTMEWTSERIVFSVNDIVHYVYNPSDKNNETWPFDAPQYLLLNVAIQPSIIPSFTESAMEIDYVRVYQKSPLNVSDSSPKEKLIVYPNPTRDELFVDISNTTDQRVGFDIYSIKGDLVRRGTTQITDQVLRIENLNALSNGFYVLKFSINDIPHSIKFIKE